MEIVAAVVLSIFAALSVRSIYARMIAAPGGSIAHRIRSANWDRFLLSLAVLAVVWLASNATTGCALAASCGVGDSETFAAGLTINADGGSAADSDTVINTDTLASVTYDAGTDTATYLGTHAFGGATVTGLGTLKGIVTFTSNGTYTPSAGTDAFVVYCTGSGGGGGGFNSTTTPNYPGTGGAGGGTGVAVITSPAASYAVTIGAVGTGGAANADGVAGGNTTLGSVCQGTGGGGGFFSPPIGGIGSGCGTSDFCILGGNGFAFNATDAVGLARAPGGVTWRGGADSGARGSGGQGGYAASTSGANGVAGSIVIFEYGN